MLLYVVYKLRDVWTLKLYIEEHQMVRRACDCPFRCNEAKVHYSDRICGKGRAK